MNKKLINLIPKMDSNTYPSGVAFSDSIFSSLYDAWNAFDKNIMTSWASSNSPFPHYIGYQFDNPIYVNCYGITSRSYDTNDLSQAPKDWILQGSNDGVYWNNIDFRNGQSWSSKGQEIIFYLEQKVSYKYYRLYITQHNGYSSPICAIGEFSLYYDASVYGRMSIRNTITNQYYSLSDNTLIFLPSTSSKNMILHGLEAGKEVQLDVPFNKIKFVQDESEVLGEGKIFTHALDISKVKVNKIIL